MANANDCGTSRAFLHHALQVGALRFGQFILKSGRQSPYFFDLGQFNSGNSLLCLGQAYAQLILAAKLNFDMLYGPAYKGIPLVTAISMALATHYQLDIPYAFNRKETKDHGEGGKIVGHPLQGQVLIIDDVISAGTSVRESIAIITQHQAVPVGIVIALDRQEHKLIFNSEMNKSPANLSTLPVFSIITFAQLLEYVAYTPQYAHHCAAMEEYQLQYKDV